MKLREKDIITLRVEGTGYAAKTDEKVRRPPWRPPRPRNARVAHPNHASSKP